MMNASPRPPDAAPGGMRGATRMYDPTEAEHDRRRRRIMNAAFVVILLLNLAQIHWIGVHGWDWLSGLLLMIAAAPLGLGAKVFELRFKMATAERRRVLHELPNRKKAEFFAYGILAIIVFALESLRFTWALWGIWLYDFITYYHDRPERIRHLYAVMKILDELRGFRAPWAWVLPALAFEVARRLL
ncbi:MAG TPA: hypothetical protein VL171_06250 [Verrucomicrobiae bacterium]|nr:hypothetical protein [Verrucomicrobiae bacterium]